MERHMSPFNAGIEVRGDWFSRLPIQQRLRSRILRIPLFWRLQIIGWTLFGVLTMPLKISAFDSAPYALLATLCREPAALLLTSGFRLVYRRLNLKVDQSTRLAAWVILLALLASTIDALLGMALDTAIHPTAAAQGAFGVFCFRCMLFCCWSFLYFWLRDQIEARQHLLNLARAKTAAQDAELLMLRAQVAPHFLFNSLNTILAGLERQPLALIPVVQGLADYFRFTLTTRHDAFIPLGDEFDAIVNYLRVEKARFRESIQIESFIDEAARSILVPGVFLQPLVENALKYGHRTSPTPLRLRVSAETLADGSVVAAVANSGDWIEPLPVRPLKDAGGHGLAILRRRLELLYRGQAEIKVSSSPANDSVIVQVRIPASNPTPSHS
jgi:hypothetical protein